MATCEQCGNDYDNSFVVTMNGKSHTFDSFECAIAKLAPDCRQCGGKIIGHGVEAIGNVYCSAHCARADGVSDAVDHVGTAIVLEAS